MPVWNCLFPYDAACHMLLRDSDTARPPPISRNRNVCRQVSASTLGSTQMCRCDVPGRKNVPERTLPYRRVATPGAVPKMCIVLKGYRCTAKLLTPARNGSYFVLSSHFSLSEMGVHGRRLGHRGHLVDRRAVRGDRGPHRQRLGLVAPPVVHVTCGLLARLLPRIEVLAEVLALHVGQSAEYTQRTDTQRLGPRAPARFPAVILVSKLGSLYFGE